MAIYTVRWKDSENSFNKSSSLIPFQHNSSRVIANSLLPSARRYVESFVRCEEQVLGLPGEHNNTALDLLGVPKPSLAFEKHLTIYLNQALESLPLPSKLKNLVRELLEFEAEITFSTHDSMGAMLLLPKQETLIQKSEKVEKYYKYYRKEKIALTYCVALYFLDTAMTMKEFHEKALSVRPFLMCDFGFDKKACFTATRNPRKPNGFDDFFSGTRIDREDASVRFPKDDAGYYKIKKPSPGFFSRFFTPCVTIDCQAEEDRLSDVLEKALKIKQDHKQPEVADAASCSGDAGIEEQSQHQAMGLG